MKTLMLALLTSALFVIGCDPAAISGSGNITSKVHAVESFNRITVKGSIDVDVKYGQTASVRVETDDNMHNKITVRVINGVVEIKVDDTSADFTKATAYVVMPSITGVTAHGSGNVVVGSGFTSSAVDVYTYGSGNVAFNGLDAEKLTSHVIGSGNLSVTGSIVDHNCTINGSGDLNASDCTTRQSAVAIFGSGSADVHVSNLLFADIFGSGNISYRGSPEVRKTLQGSGKLIKKV